VNALAAANAFRNPGRTFLAWISGGFLAAALAGQVLLLNAFTRGNIYLISSESFLLVGLCALLWAPLHGKHLLDDPIYLAVLSYVVFIGIGPLLGALSGLPLEITASSDSLALSWLGFLALTVGYGLAKLGFAHRKPRKSVDLELRLDRLTAAGIGYTAVGVAAAALYLYTLGGTDYLLYASYATRGSVSGYFSSPFGLLRPGFSILLACATARTRIPLGWGAALASFCLFDLFWFGPVRGSRHHIITFVLSSIYLVTRSQWWRVRPRLRTLPALSGVALALVLVFVWGGLRVYSFAQIAEDRLRLDISGNVRDVAFVSLYSVYDTFARIVDAVPGALPFLNGSSFYESLTVFIPRDAWPSKPVPLGDWLSINLYGVLPSIGNTVPSWPGEAYLNFGLAGLLLGMALVGALCALLAKKRGPDALPTHSSMARTLFYGATFPLVFDMMHEGSNGAAWYLFTNTAPVWIAIWLAQTPLHHTSARARGAAQANPRENRDDL
jgi:hypothetical protein